MQQGPIHVVLTSLKMTEEKARDFGGRGFIDAQIAKSNSMRVTHTDSVQNAEISATSPPPWHHPFAARISEQVSLNLACR
jgi:hypothetical protein